VPQRLAAQKTTRACQPSTEAAPSHQAELAGAAEAGVAAGSQLLTVQELRIDEIADAIHRRIGQAAGPSTISVSGDLDHVRVDIGTDRPGVVFGHGGAGADRLRAELEELTGKPVLLNILDPRPEKGRKEVQEELRRFSIEG
jgi:hypothetical protein